MPLAEYRRSAVTEQVGVVRFNEAGQAAKYAAEGLAEAAKFSNQLVSDAETRYLLEFEQAQRRRAADIAKNYPVDSEGFKAAHSESAKADLTAVPWYFRERARAVQDKLQTDHYATIVNHTMATERANSRSTYSAGFDEINKEAAAAIASGDNRRKAQADTAVETHIQLGLAQKYIDEGTASIMRRQYDDRKKRLNLTLKRSGKQRTNAAKIAADSDQTAMDYTSLSDLSDNEESYRLEAAAVYARSSHFQDTIRSHIAKVVTDGIPPNFIELSATLDDLSGPSAEKFREQAKWLENNSENLVRLSRLSPAAQAALVEIRRNAAGTYPNDPEQFFAQAVHAHTRRNFHADEFAASLNYLGVNRPDFKPLSLGAPNFNEQVSERYASAAQVSKLVGRQIAPVFAGEVLQISRQVKHSDPQEKMSLLGRIDDAFGIYSVPFWRRLSSPAQAQYDRAAARNARIALLASANRSLAASVFEGHAAVQQDPALLPGNLVAMRDWASYRIGSALQKPAARRNVLGDILHLYALEARDYGIRSRDFDSDLLAAALERRVGDPIDFNGVPIISPVIGWTRDDLRKYVATLDAEALGLEFRQWQAAALASASLDDAASDAQRFKPTYATPRPGRRTLSNCAKWGEARRPPLWLSTDF